MSSVFTGHAAMNGRLYVRGRARRSSVVSTSHTLKGLVQFLASIESAFGNFADVPSVMFYLQMSLYFRPLHQPLDLDWYAHRFDRYKIRACTVATSCRQDAFEVFYLSLSSLSGSIFIRLL